MYSHKGLRPSDIVAKVCYVGVLQNDITNITNFGYGLSPSAIDSESIKLLSVLHSGLKREW